MKATQFSRLQKELDPFTSGIFWVTQHSLKERPIYFNELDYFFEGMISENLKRIEKKEIVEDPKNFFITRHFGRGFFLAHLVSSLANRSSWLSQFKPLIESQVKPEQKILFIGEVPPDKWMKDLKKEFPEIEMKEFNKEKT